VQSLEARALANHTSCSLSKFIVDYYQYHFNACHKNTFFYVQANIGLYSQHSILYVVLTSKIMVETWFSRGDEWLYTECN